MKSQLYLTSKHRLVCLDCVTGLANQPSFSSLSVWGSVVSLFMGSCPLFPLHGHNGTTQMSLMNNYHPDSQVLLLTLMRFWKVYWMDLEASGNGRIKTIDPKYVLHYSPTYLFVLTGRTDGDLLYCMVGLSLKRLALQTFFLWFMLTAMAVPLVFWSKQGSRRLIVDWVQSDHIGTTCLSYWQHCLRLRIKLRDLQSWWLHNRPLLNAVWRHQRQASLWAENCLGISGTRYARW